MDKNSVWEACLSVVCLNEVVKMLVKVGQKDLPTESDMLRMRWIDRASRIELRAFSCTALAFSSSRD